MRKKKQIRRKKQRRVPISAVVKVREITVRYGGVIKTGNYQNKRLSYEMTADCPRRIDPDIVCDYLEALVANQFYQAQVKELENVPDEMRDEIGDISKLSPGEAAAAIANFFRNFGTGRMLTKEQKAKRIKEIQNELKKLAPKIAAETKRLKKVKNVTGDDIHPRAVMIEQQKNLKAELKQLRRP